MKGESRRRAASKTPVSEARVMAVVASGFDVGGFVGEVEAELDEFEVPVAESPQKNW